MYAIKKQLGFAIIAIVFAFLIGCGASSSESGEASTSSSESNNDSKTETASKEDADWGVEYTLTMQNPNGEGSRTNTIRLENGPTWNEGIPVMVFQTNDYRDHPLFRLWNQRLSTLKREVREEMVFPDDSEVTIMQFGNEQYREIPTPGFFLIIPRQVTGTGTVQAFGGEVLPQQNNDNIYLLDAKFEIEINEYSDTIVSGTFSGAKSMDGTTAYEYSSGEFVTSNGGDWDPSVVSTSSESEEELWDRLPGWATSELNSQLNSTYNGNFELVSLDNAREISPSHYEVTVTVRVGNTVNQVSLPLQR